MHSVLALASLAGLSCLSSLVSAAPFSYPLANGFPNPSPQTVTTIETAAHGSLPNGPPPPSLTPDTLISLRLIAFNELTEVAFFTELVANITNEVDGYTNIGDIDNILAALNAIVAQEELHALNANGALGHFNAGLIQPCEYNFPVDNFKDAIALATTFTDVVLGTLQDVQGLLGSDGDVGLIRPVGSVIGQEGEQNGYYRSLLGKIPSALPFLTTSTREFAFSALNQNFVVPGSCPNAASIALPIFKPLTLITHELDPKPMTLLFKIAPDSTINYSSLSLVYINQQNTPVVTPLIDIDPRSNEVRFQAAFPYDPATFGNGLTIAALTTSAGPFANADAVAAATYAGPALIEIN
jgi:hypothetical protein